MEKSFKLSKKHKIILLISIILCVLAFFIMRFASFKTTIRGASNIRTGRPILETQVEPFEVTDDYIHPYCVVRVKNYNSSNQVTQVAVQYEMEVTAEDNEELPEYYWSTLSGDELGTELTGEFDVSGKQEAVYKITFVNLSEEDLERNINISAKVVQK